MLKSSSTPFSIFAFAPIVITSFVPLSYHLNFDNVPKSVAWFTTIPALVQHIGDVSAIDASRQVRRTYYYSENPVANWSNPIINKGLFRTSKFAPRHKIFNIARR